MKSGKKSASKDSKESRKVIVEAKPEDKKGASKSKSNAKPVAKTPAPKTVAKAPAPKPAVAPKVSKKAAPEKEAKDSKKPAKPAPAPKTASSKSGGKKSSSAKGQTNDDAAAKLKPRFGMFTPDALKASQAAAAKLAAAAGLAPIQAASDLNDDDDFARKPLTKSPLSKKQLKEFREILMHKRAEIVGDVSSMESEALNPGGSGSLSHLPQHMADQGSDTYDQSLALDLAASQRQLLREIDGAIERIDNNTYGICDMLGIPIDLERLQAKPWARYSIDAARRIERSGIQLA